MIAATTVLCAAFAMSLASAQVTPPTFPKSFSAIEQVRVHQTGQPLQTGTVKSYWTQNGTFNATAYYSSTGETTVYLYDENQGMGNAYYIFAGRCQYYCPNPLLQEDLADSLETYDYRVRGAWAFNMTLNGTDVVVFNWTDNLGPIPMNYLWLGVEATNLERPVFMWRKITPFGDYLGWENSSYSAFNPQQPSGSVYEIPNKEYCEQGNQEQCPDSSMVMRVRKMQQAMEGKRTTKLHEMAQHFAAHSIQKSKPQDHFKIRL